MKREIIIGSRGSDLALWQAHFVKEKLESLGLQVRIQIIKTKGDKIQHLSFDKIEGKGFFTKEIEDALLRKEIDIAVHSHKDLETTDSPGLTIAAVSYRENPSDTLLIRKDAISLKMPLCLKEGAIIGTSSARRKSQLLAFRKDIRLSDIRGNVPTRIQKLREGNYQAIVLAEAGLQRLDLDTSEFKKVVLNPTHFIPAPAQGVLGIQCRADDTELISVLAKIDESKVHDLIALERKALKTFGGGCQTPFGAYAVVKNQKTILRISAASSWDSFPTRAMLLSFEEDKINKAIELLRNPKPQQVFISRDLNENSFFRRYFGQVPHRITAQSLIDFEPLVLHNLPQFDWVFFSSKRSVKYFLQQTIPSEYKHAKWACLGASTANYLRSKGIEADFVGSANNSNEIAEEFIKASAKGKILFPCSSDSLRKVQEVLEKNKSFEVIDAVVYQTIFLHTTLEANTYSAYVFTSPSNVQSFFTKNVLAENAKVVAIGESTAEALQHHKVKNLLVSEGFDEVDLVDALVSL